MVRDQGRDAKNAKLTISRVATEGGVNVETVRYYQRRGCWNSLLSPWEVIGTIPKKSCSGFVSSKGRKRSDLNWKRWPELLQLDVADGCAKSCDLAEKKL